MILILTPLALEFDLLSQALTEGGWKPQIEKKGPLTGIMYKDPAVFLTLGGHGKTQFGIQTQFLIHQFPEVKSIFCIGAAGSLTESVKAGDLVIATKTIEHDFNLKFIKKPLPEFLGDEQLLKRAQFIKHHNYKIHIGPIASGDEDIVDASRAEELFKKTSALAVAWEGAGAARACHFNHIPYLEIRTITDSADKNASVDFRQNIQLGLANVADFLRRFLQTGAR